MHVQEGEGWRLLVDPARHPFGVLIGGAGWAAELTAPEASALQQGLARLLAQRELLAGQLMAEEALTLELDLELAEGGLWLELEGETDRWQLRFVLTPAAGQRGLEGSWGPSASRAFAAALAQWVAPC